MDIKFDHDKKNVFEAMGITEEDLVKISIMVDTIVAISDRKSNSFEEIIKTFKDNPAKLFFAIYYVGGLETLNTVKRIESQLSSKLSDGTIIDDITKIIEGIIDKKVVPEIRMKPSSDKIN